MPLGAAAASPRPDRYILPGDAVFPEGIAFQDSTGYFYVSSTGDGAILRGHVSETTASVFLPGGQDGRTFATGLKVDREGRLFVSGGSTGRMFVYNTANGALLASFATTRSPNFINDVAVAKNGDAFFTDSLNPVIYRVFRNAGGYQFEEWLNLTGTAITYVAGFNLNGIVATPDGRYLIVVQSNTGKLFRITIATKAIVPINLGGATVTAGDGLLLKGRTLYVVRNSFGQIVPVQLSGDLTRGQLLAPITDPSFAFPTTVAEARGRLLVVNSQFNTRGTPAGPVLPFYVSSIPLR
jgi:Cu-Zn family superoxide dismutase